MAAQIIEIPLRRDENTQPWGFRLKGGIDQGCPLQVENAPLTGRAARAGFKNGDYILAINGAPVANLTHDQIKSEMLRGGNDLDIIVQRGAAPQPGQEFVPASEAAPPTRPKVAAAPIPLSQVCSEPTVKMGGPTFKEVQPKTYKILDNELPASEAGMGDRPSSIFDRKRMERSDYLKAKGPTIQKAYGES